MSTAQLDDLIEDVYALTSREDLERETLLAVRMATLKMHQTDFYSKDIYETGIKFSQAGYRQSFEYVTQVPNLRAFKYFRRTENSCGDGACDIEIITPEEILDSYGRQRSDVAYVAGSTLEIRSTVEFAYALLGCYVNPNVSKSGYCSWIASLFPHAIVNEAARVIFKTIGYDEQASVYERLVAESILVLKLNSIQDIGY